MHNIKKYIPERYIHNIFDIGIIIKGLDGVLETIGGVLLFLLSRFNLHTLFKL